jgi:hypothetical protein
MWVQTGLALAAVAVPWAAAAQSVTLSDLRTGAGGPVAAVAVTNDTPDTLQYVMVQCALFDATGMGLEVRQAEVEDIGPGATASGEVRFVTTNPNVGLTAKCAIADRVRRDARPDATDAVTVSVHHLRIRNIAVMAVFNVTNTSDKHIDKVPVTCTLLDDDKRIDTTITAARDVKPHATQEGLAIFSRPTGDLKGIDASCRVSDFDPRR